MSAKPSLKNDSQIRILILEIAEYSNKALELYSSLGSVHSLRELNDGDKKHITVLVIRLAYHLDEVFLKNYPALKFIVSPTTGLNHIDSDYCRRKDIAILSLKGEQEFLKSITATAELTMGLILSLVRNIPIAVRSVSVEQRWERDLFKGRDLNCLRLGILGFGRIGKLMYSYGRAFGMTIAVADPAFTAEEASSFPGIEILSKNDLLQNSDIVSLHVNYTPENENMISEKEFALMTKGAWFVNTARGELVDEEALLGALNTQHLAGAALDVLSDEQDRSALMNKKLIQYTAENNNLIITPHIGGCTSDSMHKTEEFMAARLILRAEENVNNRVTQ